MRRQPRSGAARRHAPYAVITIALLSGSLAAGILLGGLARPDGGAATAPGLRGDRLPGDLAGRPAPAFRLPDGRGGTVDTRALRGRPYALTFLYTRCLDVCPALADDIRDALGRLGDRASQVAAVAVSVDPRGDTATAVRAFAARHRLPRAFRYAIGSRSALEPVWRAYFAAPQGDDPRTSSHTAAVWLVDARGRLRALYPGAAPVAPAELAHDLRVLADEPA